MTTLKGTQTEKNILTAFAVEGQDRNRYSFYAGRAKKEGYVQVSSIFEEIANQEKEHAKRFFKFFEGGQVEFTALFPAAAIGSTLENLRAAAEWENYEYTRMYPEFARQAREDGFREIALIVEAIAVAEKHHEKRFLPLAADIEKGRVFKREEMVAWRCRNCGYVCESQEAPGRCIACAHPQSHFELLFDNC